MGLRRNELGALWYRQMCFLRRKKLSIMLGVVFGTIWLGLVIFLTTRIQVSPDRFVMHLLFPKYPPELGWPEDVRTKYRLRVPKPEPQIPVDACHQRLTTCLGQAQETVQGTGSFKETDWDCQAQITGFCAEIELECDDNAVDVSGCTLNVQSNDPRFTIRLLECFHGSDQTELKPRLYELHDRFVDPTASGVSYASTKQARDQKSLAPSESLAAALIKDIVVGSAQTLIALLMVFLAYGVQAERDSGMLHILRLNEVTPARFITFLGLFNALCLLPGYLVMLILMALLKCVRIGSWQYALMLLCSAISIVKNAFMAVTLGLMVPRGKQARLLIALPCMYTPSVGFLLQRFFPQQAAVGLIPLVGHPMLIFRLLFASDLSLGSLLQSLYVWMPLVGEAFWTAFSVAFTFYLYNVRRSLAGSGARPWWYPLQDLFYFFQKGRFPIEHRPNEDPESLALMAGDIREQLVKVRHSRNAKNADNPPLVVDHVHQRFGKVTAIEDVSMVFERGQVYALLGPNGAGKTTLLNIISGLAKPTSGRIQVDGTLGMCTQENRYWPNLTVEEHLNFFGILRGHDRRSLAEVNLQLLESVRLPVHYLPKKPQELSGGELRRFSLAMAFSGHNDITLLDEPTTGLDVKVRPIIWDIIRDRARAGFLVLLTTHSMEEAEQLATCVIILAKSRLRCIGTVRELKDRFGAQTLLTVKVDHRLADQFLAKQFPSLGNLHCQLRERSSTVDGELFTLAFGGSKRQLLVVVKDWHSRRQQLGIRSLGVVCGSLEDVFVSIIKESDVEA
jgi:ABC-type multidrug transport system ATPase subunit